MCLYVLHVEMDLFGPYYSEEHARYAQYLLACKHPDIAKSCEVLPVDDSINQSQLFEPWLLQ